MSGSRIDLPADPDGILVRLVTGIAALESAPLRGPWALVGGVAVMARLIEAHRVTRDVDTVAHTGTGAADPTVSEVAAFVGGERVGDYSIELPDGTKIDVIPTGDWIVDGLPDDPNLRLNILAHSWAAHTGETLELRVVDVTDVSATATVAVATPAALVATKLHAMRNRRRAPEKAASDAYDIYRLLAAHDRDGSLAAAIAAGPADMAALCADAMSDTFIADAGRWARRLRNYSRGVGMGTVDDEDLEVTGTLFCDQLRANA